MSGFEEEEVVSNEEKLLIAQHYLLSSPPAQFQEILTDVRKLLPENLLTDTLATGIARVYNTKSSKVVTAPSGHKVVLCPAGEVGATHYVDPNSGAVFGIDHLTLGTVDDPIPFTVNEELEEKRASLQAALSSYTASHFKPEDTASGVFAAADGSLLVVISSEKPNLRNYWSGRWSSSWVIRNPNSAPQISGEVKIHAHYFEDGNVQLQNTKSVPSTPLDSRSSADFVDATVNFIADVESKLRNGLDEIFANLNTETLRAMRRTMTIARTKMEWNINSVRMNRQIRK